MKRKLFGIMSLFVALITVLSLNSCEEVIHFYTAEVTIIDNQGNLMNGVKVTTDVDVHELHVVGQEAYTNENGTMCFFIQNNTIGYFFSVLMLVFWKVLFYEKKIKIKLTKYLEY
jgi:hypothetical protein